ncbi:MFS transporter [Sinomonas terrae]|uniref:MFS transporter n=1 Tax=Sinomonas terrae TaxID=2908838 RepID=A0ABS9U1X9_9MICC|nr:MFS transporter [Sinomonas terrae]MCH6470694.1 MFS transporter [Sinomonas terrae]
MREILPGHRSLHQTRCGSRPGQRNTLPGPVGPSILESTYPNELFPTALRATAVGLCTGTSRIGATIGAPATSLALTHLAPPGTMWIADAIAFIGAAIGLFMAPDTSGQDLEDSASLTQ